MRKCLFFLTKDGFSLINHQTDCSFSRVFVMQIPVFDFLLFFPLVASLGQTSRGFLPMMNYWSLPTRLVIMIRLNSLGIVANVFAYVLLIVIPDSGGQHLFNMRVEFKTHSETI